MTENLFDKILRFRIFGKSPVGGFLRVNQWIWNRFFSSSANLPLVRSYGRFLNALVRRYADRTQYFGTFFLRNRPQLDLIRQLSCQVEQSGTLKIAVLG